MILHNIKLPVELLIGMPMILHNIKLTVRIINRYDCNTLGTMIIQNDTAAANIKEGRSY